MNHFCQLLGAFIAAFLCLAGIPSATTAQETPAPPLELILEGDFGMLRVDKLGNIYLLEEDHTLVKYDAGLNRKFEYSFIRLGEISDLEVSNPTKLMVFFADFQIVLFLDNTLSEINRLNLEDLGYWNITSVTLSPDNHLWLYDPVNFRIIKIDASGNRLYSSNEFYFGKLDNEMQPRVTANLNYAVCYTPAEYIVFTNFAELYRTSKTESVKIILRDGFLAILDSRGITLDPVKPDFLAEKKILLKTEREFFDFQIGPENSLFLLDKAGVWKLAND